MARDTRRGQPNSGFTTIASGDPSSTIQAVVTNATISVYSIERLRVDLGPGTHVTTQVSFHDDPSTLHQLGNDSGTVFAYRLGGTVVSDTQGPTRLVDVDDVAKRDFEHDVLVSADGNQDSRIDVAVDGFEIRKGQAPDD